MYNQFVSLLLHFIIFYSKCDNTHSSCVLLFIILFIRLLFILLLYYVFFLNSIFCVSIIIDDFIFKL
jgi:hypothetical protein